jgi:hypothetical protein
LKQETTPIEGGFDRCQRSIGKNLIWVTIGAGRHRFSVRMSHLSGERDALLLHFDSHHPGPFRTIARTIRLHARGFKTEDLTHLVGPTTA